ncbi:phosphotransferase family protein [Gordonia sp. zg691]|uniref:phosphotransferase family protein n=1 Tax=Gordonia jinghuaiqii TaxID=2758710 RepID=UPI0016623DC0|nr:phosphotransferase family protein [Gordonia jinghuaiqii]MBD0862479.1 phosphotransferase family protein [Gordonia jinghuaiqii]
MSADVEMPEGVEATIRTTETDLDEVGAKLADWLAQRLHTSQRPVVSNVRKPEHSGMSSISVLFDVVWSEGGEDKTAGLVARLAPEASAFPVFPGYDLDLQRAVMDLVGAQTDLPTPRVRWVENSPDVLGTPFLVMDRVDGVVPVDNPPYVFGGWFYDLDAERQREVQDAAVGVLAQVHAVTDPVRTVSGLAGAGEHSLRRHFENERSYYEWTRRHDGMRIPVLENTFTWLEAHWPAEPSADVLCWGDARLGNIMFRDTTPTAILDWESAVAAPRELDLGWFIFFHKQFQDIAEFFDMPGLPHLFRCSDVVETYERITGVEVRDLDFYLTYAALRHGIVMSQIERRRIHFGEVQPHDDPDDYVMHSAMLKRLVDGTYEWETA